MPTEIVVQAQDQPGMLAALGELLGEADVNITAAAAFTEGGQGYIHVVLERADLALAALHDAGWTVLTVQEVLTVTLDDRPGALGRFARNLSDNGINITSLYLAGSRGGDKELVVSVDDPRAGQRPG